jgi:ribonuclease HII
MSKSIVRECLESVRVKTDSYSLKDAVWDYPEFAVRSLIKAFDGDKEALATALADIMAPVVEDDEFKDTQSFYGSLFDIYEETK